MFNTPWNIGSFAFSLPRPYLMLSKTHKIEFIFSLLNYSLSFNIWILLMGLHRQKYNKLFLSPRTRCQCVNSFNKNLLIFLITWYHNRMIILIIHSDIRITFLFLFVLLPYAEILNYQYILPWGTWLLISVWLTLPKYPSRDP